jgi:hypothetical protein
MGLTTSSRKKDVVQKPNNQPRNVETGCQVGQGSPRAVAPNEEEFFAYTPTASLSSLNIMGFVMEMQGIFREVGTEILNIILKNSKD